MMKGTTTYIMTVYFLWPEQISAVMELPRVLATLSLTPPSSLTNADFPK